MQIKDTIKKVNNGYDILDKNILDIVNTFNEEGTYEYYEWRKKEGYFLSNSDRTFLNYIENNYSKDTNILELAAGIGQVSLALFQLGYKNCTINECGEHRLNLSKFIKNGLKEKLNIKNEFRYEEKYLQKINYNTYDVIFCVEGNESCTRENTFELLTKELDKGKHLIIIDRLFGKKNNNSFSNRLMEKKYKHEHINWLPKTSNSTFFITYELLEKYNNESKGTNWFNLDHKYKIIKFYT